MKLKSILQAFIAALMASSSIAAPIYLTQNQKTSSSQNSNLQKNEIYKYEQKQKIKKIKSIIENLETKVIKISATSGTITSNKEAILKEIKKMIKFNLQDIEILIEKSSKQISLQGTPFTIILKNEIAKIGEKIKGFKVKRNQNAREINSDIRLAKFFLSDNWLSSDKTLIISSTSGTIEENKEEILKTLKTKKWYIKYKKDFFDNVMVKVKDNQDILLETNFTPIIFTVSKKGGITQEVNVFKVKRTKTQKEINEEYIVKTKIFR